MQAAEASARPQVFSFPTDYNDDPYSDSSKYESLTGPVLDQRLRQLAKPQKANDTDTVSIQPCTNPKESSQDRIAQADWDFGSGKWCFRAVFDGHSGHETVNYTSANLPEVIKGNLERHVKDNSASPDVAEVLKRSITEFDDGLTKALTDLFPGESIRTLSDDEVCEIIDKDENLPIVLRCMHGTTALVSLTNPAKTDVWVASLGDCRAVLASRTPNGSWSSKILSFNHNGTDQTEAKRIQEEHPGETGLTHNDRVLGAIAITRAIGDHVFKLPVIYSQRVFTRSRAALPTFVKKMGDVQPRVLTPPYLSNTPEVSHTKLDTPQSVLFLFSDGLFDLYDMAYGKTIAMPGFWSYLMREVLTGVDAEKEDHLALRFLRHGLGGDNEDRVSCWLTTQSQARWMDDTTILAQRMWC